MSYDRLLDGEDPWEDELTFTMQLLKETPLAILARLDDDEDEIWLPKSQITITYARTGKELLNLNTILRPDLIEVTVPEWLAMDKGLC